MDLANGVALHELYIKKQLRKDTVQMTYFNYFAIAALGSQVP